MWLILEIKPVLIGSRWDRVAFVCTNNPQWYSLISLCYISHVSNNGPVVGLPLRDGGRPVDDKSETLAASAEEGEKTQTQWNSKMSFIFQISLIRSDQNSSQLDAFAASRCCFCVREPVAVCVSPCVFSATDDSHRCAVLSTGRKWRGGGVYYFTRLP